MDKQRAFFWSLIFLFFFTQIYAFAATDVLGYRVWKKTIQFDPSFGAKTAEAASEWRDGKMILKVTLNNTIGKFPNEENTLGPLKWDQRTSMHEAKKNTTIKLKLELPGGNERVQNIPGSKFSLFTFERSPDSAGAIYWTELSMPKAEYLALIASEAWSISSSTVENGDGLEGPDDQGRVFSHHWGQSRSSKYVRAK